MAPVLLAQGRGAGEVPQEPQEGVREWMRRWRRLMLGDSKGYHSKQISELSACRKTIGLLGRLQVFELLFQLGLMMGGVVLMVVDHR